MPHSALRIPAGHCRSIRLVVMVIAGLVVPAVAPAQVIVNSGTTGPLSGLGSSVTVTLSGTIQGNGDPGVVSAPSGNETTSLVNDGEILASGNLGLGDGFAVWSNGAPIGSIANNGRIDGEARGVSIDNDGVSGVTTLTNNAGGVINGGLQMALYNGNVLGTLTNSGTIQGADGIYSLVSTGTIDNQVGGWIQGGKAIWIDGGTAGTIANAGTVYGGRGLSVSAGAGVATITNSGSFLGLGDFAVFASGTLGTLTNSGTFSGSGGIASLLGIDSLTNQAGGRIEGTSAEGVFLSGTAGTLANAAGAAIAGTTRGVTVDANTSVAAITNAGTITSASDFALFASGALGTLTNSGTFSGSGGIASLLGIDSLTNQAGRIEGTAFEGLYVSGSAGTIVNAVGATITGAGSGGAKVDAAGTLTQLVNAGEIGNTAANNGWGVFNEHVLNTLVNSGTISTASMSGGGVASFTQMDSFINQAGGLVEGSNGTGVFVLQGTMTTLTNAGTISGGVSGVNSDFYTNGVIGTLDNSGLITSGNTGVYNGYRIDTLTNSGRIEGAGAGIWNDGSLVSLVNTGTIGDTSSAAVNRVAIVVVGNLGDQSGTQRAIDSTASGALIDGRIVNAGAIHGGFSIANQDVEVAAGAYFGSFFGGTLDVVDGDLTFSAGAGGLLVLGSDVSVNGGAGTFTNSGRLGSFGTRQVTGDYAQLATATFTAGLDGESAGQYGQLVISGAAAFDGILSLDQSTLALAPGQTFELFDFASATGAFSALEVDFNPATSLGSGVWSYGGLLFTEIWTGTSMSLSVSSAVVPEIDPASCGSVVAFIGGVLSLLERKARRRAAGPA